MSVKLQLTTQEKILLETKLYLSNFINFTNKEPTVENSAS